MKIRIVLSSLITSAILYPFASYIYIKEHQKLDLKIEHKLKREFKRTKPCPNTGNTEKKCDGYWVDFIIPKKCNGPLEIRNMQYLSIKEHKNKTKYEIIGDKDHKPCMGYVR
jgi:hypothetical protein